MRKALILFVVICFTLTCSTAFAQAAKPKIDKITLDGTVKAPEKNASFPAIDLIKGAENYILIVELPGVPSKNIALEYIEGEKNYVEITGSKGEVDLKITGKKVQNERFIGKFTRKIDITDDIIKDKISAEFKDSVLVVTLPIRKFQVKTSIKIK